jgi:ATP-binding cassette, subfamily B, bacterial PglK|tara:strand:- start:617 stop:2419 length:1803 start_codon:yes stop_codon:yes gene_type:complete
MKTIKKILYLLTPRERKHAGLLLVMALVMAFIDMIGVASILPFVAVLTNPSIIETNVILKTMLQFSNKFGVETNQQFMFVLGIIVFVLFITSIAFKALTTYVQLVFMNMREYTIGKRLLDSYINQPYSWVLDKHSADLGKSILSEVELVVQNSINPLMQIITQIFVGIALISLLILHDPKLSLIACLALIITYVLTYSFIRGSLRHLGEQRLKNNKLRFTIVSELFNAFKEIKVGVLEKNFIKRFADPAKTLAKHEASSKVLASLPHFALEAIAFGGMLLLILFLMSRNGGSLDTVLPIIALYALAGYRLMPALQIIYSSIVQLRFVGPSLDALFEDLERLTPINLNENHSPLKFNKEIILNHIYYNYPNSSKTVIKDISLSIPARSTVGIVGSTGSGKTTTVDIILGLLKPNSGTLEIDDIIIDKDNYRSWQRTIGYVPQQIYIADDTVAANIAFGVDYKDINQEALEYAAKISNLHEFVINELPKKYETKVGERGVKLSGGQRQRIGIARALYHKPQLLIMDEGTSSLDNITEYIIMETISKIKKDFTIILVAHRLNTVKNCDNIFILQNGQVKEQGSFEELMKNSEIFNKMLKPNKS